MCQLSNMALIRQSYNLIDESDKDKNERQRNDEFWTGVNEGVDTMKLFGKTMHDCLRIFLDHITNSNF